MKVISFEHTGILYRMLLWEEQRSVTWLKLPRWELKGCRWGMVILGRL